MANDVFVIHSVRKKRATIFLPLCQMLIDFQNYFADRLSTKFPVK